MVKWKTFGNPNGFHFIMVSLPTLQWWRQGILGLCAGLLYTPAFGSGLCFRLSWVRGADELEGQKGWAKVLPTTSQTPFNLQGLFSLVCCDEKAAVLPCRIHWGQASCDCSLPLDLFQLGGRIVKGESLGWLVLHTTLPQIGGNPWQVSGPSTSSCKMESVSYRFLPTACAQKEASKWDLELRPKSVP
jgi:hypothetical protein